MFRNHSRDRKDELAADALVRRLMAEEPGDKDCSIHKLVENNRPKVIDYALQIISEQLKNLRPQRDEVLAQTYKTFPMCEHKLVNKMLEHYKNQWKENPKMQFTPEHFNLQSAEELNLFIELAQQFTPVNEQIIHYEALNKQINDELGDLALDERLHANSHSCCVML